MNHQAVSSSFGPAFYDCGLQSRSPAMLSCVAELPTSPLAVDVEFVATHCRSHSWAQSLATVVVEPLGGNGGGLTGCAAHVKFAILPSI